jgi:hypothetical protein
LGIPEAQLDSWSKLGSVTQSAATYQSIKAVVDSPLSPYYSRDCLSFLQGSYANETNIVGRDSDVDIVLRSNATYFYNVDDLPPVESQRFENSSTPATYSFSTYKQEVYEWLRSKYNTKVTFGNKAISIAGDGSRRDADVIPCFQYRKYKSFPYAGSADFVEGICFFANDGTKVVNYPRLHSAHGTWKHQNTQSYYKPMVRILKNMRNKCIDNKLLAEGVAPSYFIEGLLYNAPHGLFANSYADTFVATINWLDKADRSKFVCVNDQYLLLHPTSPVTWRAEKCEAFIRAVCKLWNEWA